MIELEKNNGEIEEKILQAIEQLWEISNLPQKYRDFLLKYNGGIPQKKRFWFKGKRDGSYLTEFYGIIKSSTSNLLMEQKNAGERIPDNTLPIADDIYGNWILISLKGPDRGKIYFWDHELESYEGEIPDYSNLTLIADSFEEFINSLQDEHEENLRE